MISNTLRWLTIGLLTLSLVQAQEIQGTPGVDYPNFVTIPSSSFKCSDQEFIPGFYADLETQCQAYHYCSEEGQETFLCPIGSIFNQAKLTCDVWYNSNCTLASQLFSSNSGSLLENAMKNVPLLIKLRNRSKNKFSFKVPAADLYEKITSLYEGSEFDESSTEGSSVSNDVDAERNPDIKEEAQGELLNEESLDDILSRLEESIQDDYSAAGTYDNSENGNEGAPDHMQTNLLFDPVTERYYVDPELSQNEWSRRIDDEFGYYDRENFAYKYGLAMNDVQESDYLESSDPIDLYGLREMDNEEIADDKFSKRQMNLERPSRRLRRKPIYTVIQEDNGDNVPIGMRDDIDSVMDSEDYVSTESIIVTDDSSQSSDETTTETEVRSSTRAPFEMVDLSRMHMTPLSITEEPMTSEEFEDAIITELVIPKIDKHDLRVIGPTSDQGELNEGYADVSSSDAQNYGHYRYVDNESPEQFVYSNVYEESDSESLETNPGASENIDDTKYYRDEDKLDEDSEKSDDTFVVIPDESEIPEFTEVFDTSESSHEESFRDLNDQNINEESPVHDLTDSNIPSDYESQGMYSADPTQYRTPRFSPSAEYGPEYFQQGYFEHENEEASSLYDYTDESYMADDPQAIESEHNQYGVEAQDQTDQYMYASQASYACQVGYSNCMYGSQSENPYAGYYHNPYVNFPYGVPGAEDTSESPSADEASYYSEPQTSYMIQSDQSNDQFEINQDYEHPDSYEDRKIEGEESPSDNSATALGNEIVEPETYYVLEDDDQTNSEVVSESVSEPSSFDEVESASEVIGNQGETYYVLEDEDEEKMVDSEVDSLADVSENEEVHEQQASSQHKTLHLEESSHGNSADRVPSQTADSEDVSQSEENSVGSDGSKSHFGSAKDSKFTHLTDGGLFTSKSDRNGDALLDSSEPLSRNDETSKVLVSSHSNLPNMFLNSMAYSDPTNFGPHGFGSSFGQPMMVSSPTAFTSSNGRKRTGDSASPNVSKLSALQERIRSLKQGKFGAFKKYVSSSGSKN